MEKGALKVVLIGAGLVAERAHLPAWREQPDARVSLIVDVNAERAAAVARRWEIPRWAMDWRAVLDDASVTAVDICLPPHLHAIVTKACLAAGKHVLVEKPIATTIADAQGMVEAAARARRTLMVAENWPFSSAARQVLKLLHDGALGDVFSLRAHHETAIYLDREHDLRSWARRPEQVGGGYLMDAGMHTINLARHLLGEYSSLFAYTGPQIPSDGPPPETEAVVAARFRAGGLASMSFTGRSRHLGGRRLGFALFASRGIATFEVASGHVSWTVDGKRTTIDEAVPSLGYSEEIRHFLDCVRTGAAPLTSGEHQLGTLAAVLAAYRSNCENRPVDPAELLADKSPPLDTLRRST